MRGVAIAAAVLLMSTPAAAGQLVAAKGYWAAFVDRDRGECRAVARAERIAVGKQVQASVTIRFGRQRGLGFRLSHPQRPGSSVMLTVGDRPFQLLASGGHAWSRGGAQDGAILAAIRSARAMRVAGRDPAGRSFSDRYLLAGAPTAIDAAAAACSRLR